MPPVKVYIDVHYQEVCLKRATHRDYPPLIGTLDVPDSWR